VVKECQFSLWTFVYIYSTEQTAIRIYQWTVQTKEKNSYTTVLTHRQIYHFSMESIQRNSSVLPTHDQTYRPDQQKIALTRIMIEADITVFYSRFLSQKNTKI
jgi:hypothetical protein